MTLDSVRVDCIGAFDPGQISVALGRVSSPDQITVVNFRPGLCPPHPPLISTFYGQQSADISPTLNCCRTVEYCIPTLSPEHEGDNILPTTENCDDESSGYHTDTNSDDDGEVVLPSMPPLPPNITVPKHKEHLTFQNPITNTQRDVNASLHNIKEEKLHEWITYLYNKISSIYHSMKGPNKPNNCVKLFLNDFDKSGEFHDQMKELLHTTELCKDTCTLESSAWSVSKIIFESVSHLSDPSTQCDEAFQGNSGLPKLHYIAGMCVGRVLYRRTQMVCRNILSSTPSLQQNKDFVIALRKHTFTSLTIARNETSHPDSLDELVYHQTKYGHLMIVDDALFHAFVELQKIVTPLLTPENLHQQQQQLFSHIMDCSQHWLPLPHDLTIADMRPVIEIYVHTCLKEMGARLEKRHQVMKKLAHRKQVLLEEVAAQGSIGGESSRSRSIPQCGISVDVSNADEGENDGVDKNACIICHKKWKSNQRFLWIECTKCFKWLHRKCDVSLKPQRVWKAVSAEGAMYTCPLDPSSAQNDSKRWQICTILKLW